MDAADFVGFGVFDGLAFSKIGRGFGIKGTGSRIRAYTIIHIKPMAPTPMDIFKNSSKYLSESFIMRRYYFTLGLIKFTVKDSSSEPQGSYWPSLKLFIKHPSKEFSAESNLLRPNSGASQHCETFHK
jgi:hypothetical protein